MKIIAGGRRTGKTTQLLKEVEKRDGIIITSSKMRAQQLFNMARDLGIDIRMPISLFDLKRSKLTGSMITNMFVDDAEYVLEHLLSDMTCGRGHIEAITINLAELHNTLIMTSNNGGGYEDSTS